jgi:hypothetical protein
VQGNRARLLGSAAHLHVFYINLHVGLKRPNSKYLKSNWLILQPSRAVCSVSLRAQSESRKTSVPEKCYLDRGRWDPTLLSPTTTYPVTTRSFSQPQKPLEGVASVTKVWSLVRQVQSTAYCWLLPRTVSHHYVPKEEPSCELLCTKPTNPGLEGRNHTLLTHNP